MYKHLLIILLFSISLYSYAQNETGRVSIRIFSAKEYGAAPQNLYVLQDKRGIIYISNAEGILEYDGTTWRLIQIPNKSYARSMAIDSAGTIFLGSSDNFGYLKPNENGKTEYNSLMKYFNTKDITYSDIWHTVVVEPYVYFQSFEKIFRYNKINHQFIVLNSQKHLFSSLFKHNNQIYVSDYDKGLYKITASGSLEKIDKGNFLIKSNSVKSGIQLSNDTVLLLLSNNLCYYLPNDKTPINESFKLNQEINDLIKNKGIANAVKIGEDVAISIRFNGLIVLNRKEKKQLYLNKNTGTPDNIVINSGVENNNIGLWLCQGKGISRIDYPSALSFWNENNGLFGIVEDVKRYKGRIYVATHSGVYFLKEEKVIQVKGIENNQSSVLHFFYTGKDTILLCGNMDNLYEIHDNDTRKIISAYGVFDLYSSQKRINTVYVLCNKSINALEYKNGSWINLGTLPNIKGDIRCVVEDSLGNIWLSTFREGVYKIEPGNEWQKPKSIKLYNKKDGFVSLKNILIYKYDNDLVFTSDAGLFKYNAKADKFEYDKRFGENLANNTRDVFFFIQDCQKQVWISRLNNSQGKIAVGKKNKNNVWEWNETPFKKIPDMFLVAMYIEPDGTAWFGGSEGLYKYNPHITQNYDIPFHTLIRKISIGTDSVIYWGGFSQNELEKKYNNLKIKYEFNSLTINYCATDFQNENTIKYNVFLKGFDKTWSDWISDSKKEYTNLNSGEYTFYVKSKNIYEKEGSTAKFSFTILPPWYKTWWSILIYLILFFGFVILCIILYTHRLIAQKMRLELIVKERTAEISIQKEEILSQRDELKESNNILSRQKEEIQLKSDELSKLNNELTQKSNQLQEYSSELEKLSIVASKTDNAIIIMDNNFNFEWINEGFTKIYGYTFDELVLIYGKSLLIASKHQYILEIVEKCRNTKQSVIYENNLLTKNNHSIWIQTTLTPIINNQGDVLKYIAIDSDITQIKNVEIELIKQTKEIENQHQLIVKQNEKIKGSLRSAQTIQNAILPDSKLINQYFDHFIIYKPKDIVSGDFYWFTVISQNNNKNNQTEKCSNIVRHFFAVADCTGHGVPGAFMSMIGSRLLSEIIVERKILSPNKILNELRTLINISLKQNESENQDGMDIALCVIEKSDENASLTFSGAKINAFLYAKTTNEFISIKGDRMSIGGYLKIQNNDFTNQNYNLVSGDIIFMSTDGLIDQNNKDRKRFGISKLQKFLFQNINLSMSEQKSCFEDELNKWMNATDQRDDITLVGLKI